MDFDDIRIKLEELEKTALQLPNVIDIVARMIRPKIKTWLEKDTSAGRKSDEAFIDDLKRIYILRTRFAEPDKSQVHWRTGLLLAVEELKLKPEDSSHVTDTWLRKTRSPDLDFVKPKAYKFLLHLERILPKDQSWFIKHAIEVTFKAFELKGKLESFKTYLRQPFRQKQLPRIMPQDTVTGLLCPCILLEVEQSFCFLV